MTDSGGKNARESSSSQKTSKRQRQRQRYTMEQTQQLEAFFKKCQHPDEDQQNQLAIEAGLDPKQIKFWFQNKRSQTKMKNKRSDNNTLRVENEKFRSENMAMKEAMKIILCPQCDGPLTGEEERARNLENLKIENQWLREENARISNIISSSREKSFVMGSNLTPPADKSLSSQIIYGSPIGYPPLHPENNPKIHNNVQADSININNIPIISPSAQQNYSFHRDYGEASIIFKVVIPAMAEMLGLSQMNDPLWEKSSTDERLFIHRESYERTFPNSNRPYKSSTARVESSKDWRVVTMTATELIQIFLDPIKWMNMFPTMVIKARILDFLNSGDMGISIQLMYEKLHILSPLVEARDFFFIRCCKQHDQNTWIMVDVSYDLFNEIQTCVPSYAWKFPSGCVIRDLGDGKSMVTWIEHVQVNEKNQANHIFRDLLYDRQTYGAKRWIVTLQRMSERYKFSMDTTYLVRHDLNGVINDIPEVAKNVKQISQRMVKSFCEILSMTDKVDFSTSAELNNAYRVSIRKTEEATQLKGYIATAATSTWLPLSFKVVFNFLKDNRTRYQWDVLANGNNVTELARVLTGTSPGNDITIIQSDMLKENDMLVLQESSIDEMEAFLIYAPIDLPIVTSVANGGNATNVVVLPLGIIISPDSRFASERDTYENAQDSSIMTMAFQKFICANNISVSQEQLAEAVASVHNLLCSTVLQIKAALGCSD